MPADLRKLKDEAARALEKGKHRAAFDAYVKLAQADAREPGWAHRAGEIARRLGLRDEALHWLGAAADSYARQGFLLKAIAVCKVILDLDPGHQATQSALANLYARQQGGSSGAAPPGNGERSLADVARLAHAVENQAGAKPLGGSETPAGRPHGARMSAAISVPLRPGQPLETVELDGLVEEAAAGDGAPAEDGDAVLELDLDDLVEEPAAAPARPDAAMLPAVPLFSDLAPDSLRALIERLEMRTLEAGESICQQGEIGVALYVVARGEAIVMARGSDGREVEVGRLGEGAFFGEVGLLTDAPRSATVRAAEETQILVIDRTVVATLIADSPAVLGHLLRFLRDRLLATLTATSPLFEPFSEEERRTLVSRFKFVEVKPGTVLVSEGERAGGLSIFLCGLADVERGGSPIATLGAGEICGEMSLLTHEPAGATVRARTKCWVLTLSRDGFQELVVTHPQALIYVSDLAEARRRGASSGDATPDTSRLALV